VAEPEQDAQPGIDLLPRLAALGIPAGPLRAVHGGFANRLYRLDTEHGSFAVKQMNLADRRTPYRARDVLALERAAFAAGVPMPEPLVAEDDLLVHRWVEGEAVPEEPLPVDDAFSLGEVLARVHALDVGWPRPADEEPVPVDWADAARRALRSGQPWAAELDAQVGTFETIARFVETCERPGPLVLTHRDVQPWNLLRHEDGLVLLDWELSGLLDLAGELGSTALGVARGPDLDPVEPAVFSAVLEGYVAGGGTLPPPGPHWFVYLVAGWLSFTRWSIERCLTAGPARTGPALAVSQQSALDGIRGLPALHARLDDLQQLVPG
jgi:hypothetical protein